MGLKFWLTAGMSGCHLLCSGFSCSHGFLEMSTLMRGVGVRGGMLLLLLLLLLLLSNLSGCGSVCWHSHLQEPGERSFMQLIQQMQVED
jgi:hypothetical protein